MAGARARPVGEGLNNLNDTGGNMEIQMIDVENKTKFQVQIFGAIRARVQSDEIALGILREVNKDRRQEIAMAGRKSNEFRQSQLNYLKRLGVKVEGSLDRKTANLRLRADEEVVVKIQ